MRKCRHCHVSIEHKRPQAVWCSEACRVAHYRIDNPPVHQPRSSVAFPDCTVCGGVFAARYSTAKVCPSDVCRKAYNVARMREGKWGVKQNALRRMRVRSTTAESFHPDEVFDRDGWTCGICHDDVDPTLEYPHPQSVSLDHIVPLVEGGDHTRANTRCTHLRCNLARGARGGGEQLALVG